MFFLARVPKFYRNFLLFFFYCSYHLVKNRLSFSPKLHKKKLNYFIFKYCAQKICFSQGSFLGSFLWCVLKSQIRVPIGLNNLGQHIFRSLIQFFIFPIFTYCFFLKTFRENQISISNVSNLQKQLLSLFSQCIFCEF